MTEHKNLNYGFLQHEGNYGSSHLLAHLIDIVKLDDKYDETDSEIWEFIELLLTDLNYIGMRCYAEMVYELINEYSEALNLLENDEETSRKKRIQVFAQFLNSQSHAILKFAHLPQYTIQHAFNSSLMKSVHDAAEELIQHSKSDHVLLNRISYHPQDNNDPPCLKILEGHTAEIFCIDITPDGRRAISGSADSTLRIWDGI